jgi:photosystem II stability/assembly factor-like uncharacterized protein
MPRIVARQRPPLRLLLLLVALVAPTRAVAQEADAERCRPELTVRGDVRRLTLAPDGQVWLADTTGRTYRAAGITADFERGSLSLAESADGFRIHHISFIDDRTAIATGDMWAGADQTSLYRTHDGGANWQVVSAGAPVEAIASVHVGSGGDVWIGGTAGELRWSADAGLTWRRLTAPFEPGGTTNAIAMVSTTVGFVGAREGSRIRMTMDGGQSWQDVPGPGDATGRGAVERLGVVGSQLIAQIDGRVFHSDVRDIAWQPFEGPRLVLFAIDRAQRAMAGLSADRRLIMYDSGLVPTALTGALPTQPIDLSFGSGVVHAVDEDVGLYRASGSTLSFTYPLTGENPSLRLQIVRSQRGRLVGVSERHVYASSDGGSRWCRIGHVTSGIAGMAVQDSDRVLLWDGQGSNVLFDLRDGSTSEALPLAGYAITRVTELSDRWLAYGRHDAASRRGGAAPAAGDGRAMPALHSVVLLSRDRGATWSRAASTWSSIGSHRESTRTRRRCSCNRAFRNTRNSSCCSA